MNRGGLDPMWQAGVGVRLPLRRARRHAGVAEAEARLRAAERRREDLDLQLRYRTHERLTQLRTLARVAHLYGDGIIPQDRMSVEAAVANYQAGKVPFVAVLEALATLYGDRSTYLGLLSDHATTRAGLEEARLDGGASMGAALPEAAGPGFGAGAMGAATPMSDE
jgi:outer membrane protein TolC